MLTFLLIFLAIGIIYCTIAAYILIPSIRATMQAERNCIDAEIAYLKTLIELQKHMSEVKAISNKLNELKRKHNET